MDGFGTAVGESPPPVLTEITLSFEEMDLITRDKIHEGY